MRLGEKLYSLREKQGLSQEELAEKLDVSRQTISNWENDKVKIDVEKAVELCKIFNVGMDELFGDGQLRPDYSKKSGKLSLINIAFIALLIVCVALIITSAVFLAKYNPDEISSTVMLTPAAGWVLISCGGLIILGIITYLLIINFKKK